MLGLYLDLLNAAYWMTGFCSGEQSRTVALLGSAPHRQVCPTSWSLPACCCCGTAGSRILRPRLSWESALSRRPRQLFRQPSAPVQLNYMQHSSRVYSGYLNTLHFACLVAGRDHILNPLVAEAVARARVGVVFFIQIQRLAYLRSSGDYIYKNIY